MRKTKHMYCHGYTDVHIIINVKDEVKTITNQLRTWLTLTCMWRQR